MKDLQHEGRAITHDLTIKSYNTDGKLIFVDFCRQELEESKRTISEKHYNTTRYQIDKLARYRPDLTLQHLNFEFLQKYKYYLVEKGNKPNTLHGDFKMIRKFLNLAIKKGLTKNYPFKDFELPSDIIIPYIELQY